MRRFVPGIVLGFLLVAGLLMARATGQADEKDKAAPPTDPIKPLAIKIDQLTKDLVALKALEKRLAATEKSIKGIGAVQKAVDDLGKQAKPLMDRLDKAEAAAKKLEGLPAQLKTLEERLGKAEAAAKKLEGLPAQLKTLDDRLGKAEKAAAGLDPRFKKLEKSVEDLDPRFKKLEKSLADLDPRFKKLEKDLAGLDPRFKQILNDLAGLDARFKKLEDELKKAAAGGTAASDRLKAIEAQLKKEKEERENAIKKLEEELKKATTPAAPVPLPGTVPVPGVIPPCPIILPPCNQCSVSIEEGYQVGSFNYLYPTMATGHFGEGVPVLGLGYAPGHMPGADECWNGGAVWNGHGMPYASDSRYELPQPTMPPAQDGKVVEPKNGKSIELKREDVPGEVIDEPNLPGPFHMMSRRTIRPTTESLMRETAAGKKVKRPVQAIDLRGLSVKDADGLFWKGYRLYWENKLAESQPYFEAASELADEDARYWYYRALSESALGRSIQAQTSLKQAVELQLRGQPSQEAISKALERVQGEARMQIRQALDARRSAR